MKKNTQPNNLIRVEKETELMKFLMETFPTKSRQRIKRIMGNKRVVINGESITQFNFKLHCGDKVYVKSVSKTVSEPIKGLSIVFEDQHLIVIDKHAGVLSIATTGETKTTAYNFLSQYVKRSDPDNKIFIVHRLDRETSGIMMFAKSTRVQHLLQDNWKESITERSYVAVVEGKFENNEGVISSYLHENSAFVVYSNQEPEGGKKAITNYKVLKSNFNYSLLEVRLDTGRKNQIRVHMQDLGHPIVNDKKYGSQVNPFGRLGLHSRVLGFIHPITHEKHRFATPIPSKFSRLF